MVDNEPASSSRSGFFIEYYQRRSNNNREEKMGTTIDYPVQSLDAWTNRSLANTKAPKSLEKSSEQPGPPDKATKAGESQVRDLDMANDPRDMVEIQNLNDQVIEANQTSLENTTTATSITITEQQNTTIKSGSRRN